MNEDGVAGSVTNNYDPDGSIHSGSSASFVDQESLEEAITSGVRVFEANESLSEDANIAFGSVPSTNNAATVAAPVQPAATRSTTASVETTQSFNDVTLLGCSQIDEPRSEDSIQRVMAVLNGEKTQDQMRVIVVVPSSPEGVVRILDDDSKTEISQFRVDRILFCARGLPNTSELCCFGFTYLQSDATDHVPNPLYVCHVFRCSQPETVGRVLVAFACAFNKTRPLPKELKFEYDVSLDIKEDDAKNGYVVASQEKQCFKLRRNREKKVLVTVQQVGGRTVLMVQKCFGLLLAAGRNVRHADMHLLDMQSMGRGGDGTSYAIEALWDPRASHFEVLNTETPKDTRVNMTIAADVVLAGIHEPVRFIVECKARIFHEHERFWYVARRPVVERYFLTLRKLDAGADKGTFEVVSFESRTEQNRKRVNFTRSPSKMATNLVAPCDDDESDGDEPLLSGSGDVSKEWSEDVLTAWSECLIKWRTDTQQRPRELPALIRNGVPDALRGEVWQLLCRCDKDPDMMETYRLLIAKECPNEQVIQRDIHRTFPAHDFFKEAGGVGQDSLYKLSKAYSLYDEEVGYCQGLSFLAASLLLHLPEEQAFCVLVKLMFDYSLRDLFKQGFETLHLRFYQLERLIEDYIPDLYQHFVDINVETHMYASQWFLTLFTAKFPLTMVFHIVDLFLCEGVNTIFHISIALLKASKKELLQMDFEGALKFFRVALPRKYRTEATAKELIQQAVKLKISHKRLTKYEKEYNIMKQQEQESLDPLERFERENLRLKENVLRLERENDDLAHELVTSKIQLRNHLDAAEDNIESLQKQLEILTRTKHDMEEENARLSEESEQVKEMCRRELQRLEEENTRGQTIIANYKQISSDLSNRLEKQQNCARDDKKQFLARVRECPDCSKHFLPDGSFAPSPLNSPLENGGMNDLDVAQRLAAQDEQIRQLELELAQTKLCLVETQCRSQDLVHQLNSTMAELQERDRKTTWLNKAVSSIREVAKTTGTGAQQHIRKDTSRDSVSSS